MSTYSPNGKARSPSVQKPRSAPYDLLSDPVFYGTVAFFAFLTTALPGALGQVNFMPLVQALALTVFLGMALKRRRLSVALRVAVLWIGVQFLTMVGVSTLLPGQAERAIPGGFYYRTGLLEWGYTGEWLPGGLLTQPRSRLLELLGVSLGSLVTAGLVGAWVLVREVNQLAFSWVALSRQIPSGMGPFLGLMPWRWVELAGDVGLVLLFAQPMLRNAWQPRTYWVEQRRLVQATLVLTAGGLALDLLLPGLWQTAFRPQLPP